MPSGSPVLAHARYTRLPARKNMTTILPENPLPTGLAGVCADTWRRSPVAAGASLAV
ncbi:hypothetical protein [Propionivibrio dicarboxylicus]|uniref:hypothetical protein n=1 Tax=Propionivibrio dicarboxylicus TaxID=83767 RepID=UPI0015A1F975|nr:hypothetical protein [Propionivibrio dicarboxylicus]